MNDNKQPGSRFQFSLKSFLTYSVVAAIAISFTVRLANASPLAIGLVALWLIVTLPVMFFADIVDWILGVKKDNK